MLRFFVENWFVAFFSYSENDHFEVKKDKEILIDFFSDKNGVLLTEQIKGAMVTELIKRGLTNGKQNTDFTFDYVKKKCREYNVCDFIKASANKKDAANNPDIIYRNKYLKIKLL